MGVSLMFGELYLQNNLAKICNARNHIYVRISAKIFVHVPKAWVMGKAYHNYSNKAAVTMQ